MSERKPDHWIMKNKDGKYWAYGSVWSNVRTNCIRYTQEPKPSKKYGTIVPVYVTVKKIKKGHSWSWACKRLLEGKAVRLRTWHTRDSIRLSGDGLVCWDNTSNRLQLDKLKMSSTDWELYNE